MQAVILIVGVLIIIYSFYTYNKNTSKYSGKLFFFGVMLFIFGLIVNTNNEYHHSSLSIDHSIRNMKYGRPSFNGYPCTDDCSGHNAGYQWAEENSISTPDDCDGKSDSFNEGCFSYLNDIY